MSKKLLLNFLFLSLYCKCTVSPSPTKGTMRCKPNCLHWHRQCRKSSRTGPRSEKHCQQNNALLVATKPNSRCFGSLLSSRRYLISPSTVWSSWVTTRNLDFQQLATDKKLNPNQWEVRWIEFKLCEDTGFDHQYQKAKAQHSVLFSNLHRQGYREVKLHVEKKGICLVRAPM